MSGADGVPRHFNHPFMQSSFMFVGEMLCFLVFKLAYAYLNRKNVSLNSHNKMIISSNYFFFLFQFNKILILMIFFIFQDGSVDTNQLTKGSRNFNPLVLFIPASCDMIATSIMYVGLNLTYASSFQMLRGSVIVFTGILSMGFLNRKFGAREWSGITMVIIGLAIVGASDLMMGKETTSDTNSIITGDLLIICAQVKMKKKL